MDRYHIFWSFLSFNVFSHKCWKYTTNICENISILIWCSYFNVRINIPNIRVSSHVKSSSKSWKGSHFIPYFKFAIDRWPHWNKYSLSCRELEELSVTDFVHLEKQLEAALMQTRTTKVTSSHLAHIVSIRPSIFVFFAWFKM